VADHIQLLREFVERETAGRASLRVLEAGCGSATKLELDERAHVVGIDISRKQLERNQLIHEAIEGDLMTHRFEEASFDLIVSIDVLEHLDRPVAALANLRDALAPGGLMVLKIPNAMSAKGLFTKITPHGLHVWVYRRFLGHEHAGTDDVGPFKTYMRLAIRPRAIRRWAESARLELVYEDYYESSIQKRLRQKLGLVDLFVRLGEGPARTVSGNRFSLSRTEYVVVLRNVNS
jgi:SAM-dependent methyltransferase